jgi:catechol 2,3-dioxygenase-like lactoylglutathione lyase family enzyme
MSGEIVGIDHVQLAMPEGREADAVAFYAGILGLAPVEKPPELTHREGRWFSGPSVGIHLGVDRPFHPARKAHPALLVADFDAYLEHLERHGVRIRVAESIGAQRRCHLEDPFGNRIELVERIPST